MWAAKFRGDKVANCWETDVLRDVDGFRWLLEWLVRRIVAILRLNG